MTLSANIKALLKSTYAPHAFFTEFCAAVMGAFGSSHVSIVDFLIFWQGAAHTGLDRGTLAEFAQLMLNQIIDSICVIICDNRANVPTLKRQTQGNRSADRAKADAKKGLAPAQPYPVGARLTDEGMITYTVFNEEEDAECEVVEPISMRRLAESRWYGKPDRKHPVECSNIGNELWHAFHPFVQAHLMKMTARQTQQVILDHAEDRMWDFRRDNPHGPKVDTGRPHSLGESDTAHIWWLKQFDGQVDAVHIRSTDGDVMAIYAMYHDQRSKAQRARTRVWWHCGKGEVVDLAMLTDGLLLKAFSNPVTKQIRAFQSSASIGLFYILCGTDFVKRSVYAFGRGSGVPEMMIDFLGIDFGKLNRMAATHPTKCTPSYFLEQFMLIYHARILGKGAKGAAAIKKQAAFNAKPATIESLRERSREREAQAKLDAEKKHKQVLVQFAEETHNMLMRIDAETRAAFEVRRKSELDEVNAKFAKRLKHMWRFPDKEEIDWAAQVICFNYSYWLRASTGCKPVEPRQSAERQEASDEEESDDDEEK